MENMEDARALANLFRAMRRHPRPIVAVVKGRALAGGCGLATACDIVLAAETAQFGYPEVNIGFVPAMVMAILRRSVSEKRAFEWITLGETVSARDAEAAGLVNRVFAVDQMDAEVAAYVDRLAAKSMSALALCKNLLYHMDSLSFDAAIEAGVHMNGIARMTEDCKAGVDRFLKPGR
jgi:methylglutaconyl-CoA hydratase